VEKKLLIKIEDIKPSRPDFRVIGIFNPGVIRFNHKIIMLARVAEARINDDDAHIIIPMYRDRDYSFLKIASDDPNFDFSDCRVIRNHEQNYLSSISHFRVGYSNDGIHFKFDEAPILPSSIYEEYGIEDPRITFINNRYYITYTAVSTHGINVALMVTDDFKTFEHLGNIFPFDNKDCVIFPQKIGDYYYAYHRPSKSDFGKLDIWLARSTNLIHWGEHKVMPEARTSYGNNVRFGAGAVPFLTTRGWVIIYHCADKKHHYHLTAMLVNKDDPSKVLMKSKAPLIEPSEPYDKNGFVPEVIFTCGLINDEKGICVYYGAGDQQIASCRLTYEELFANMEAVV